MKQELAQALARLDNYAPLTIAMILITGAITKAGHAARGVSLFGGYIFLFCAATQLSARARTKGGSRPLATSN
jgi:hypothetical protein